MRQIRSRHRNAKAITLWIDCELQDLLAKKAKEQGLSRNGYMVELIAKYVMGKPGAYPVTLEIPTGLTEAELRVWLSAKCERIIDRLRDI